MKYLVPTLASKQLKKINFLKDKHKGETCYLFGDGISIKNFDIKNFNNYCGIPCSFIPFHKEFKYLNTPYLLLIEPYWFYPYIRLKDGSGYVRNKVQSKYREIILKNQNKDFFINLSNYPIMRSQNIYFIFRKIFDDSLGPDFLSNKFNCFNSSIQASILLSIYLGFEKAYMVGFDYTHEASRVLHFYEKGEGYLQKHVNFQKEFLEEAQKYIELITVTLEGKGSILPSVTYQELTGKSPIYQENTEIVDKQYLDALNSWPGYSIY